MRQLGTGRGGVVAIAAFRDRHFQGYALRTPENWICIVALGMTWSKLRAHSLEEARMMLRATSHASRFEDFRDADDLISRINRMPPYQQPGILPQQIGVLPAKLPKLAT